jgi:ubiquinone/menaquinone biosynthesis C-methylase UbiE
MLRHIDNPDEQSPTNQFCGVFLEETTLENASAYLKAAILITLTLPVRLAKRFYRFQPPPLIASIIEVRILASDFRRKLQPEEKIVERSGIKAGMSVLELGCGLGVYTLGLARAVGNKGKLYALDMQLAMIERLRRRLEKPEYTEFTNIETRLANAYELPFTDESIDSVVMVAVLPEIPDKDRALKEIGRILKPGGILAISETLIDPDYPLRRTTKEYCRRAGFVLLSTSGSFFNYTMQFEFQRHHTN